MLHYYVYYRVAPSRVREADAAVRQILLDVSLALGVQGRMLKKCDEPLLWMEVYENVAAATAFEARLARATASAGLARHLAGERQLECFSD